MALLVLSKVAEAAQRVASRHLDRAEAWLLSRTPALSVFEIDADVRVGIRIVRRALEEPMRQIVANAGGEPSVVVGRVRESDDPNYGYNARTDAYEDLLESGIIDPAKVTRTALQNAASIAGLLLTTESVVVERPAQASPGPGSGRGATGDM